MPCRDDGQEQYYSQQQSKRISELTEMLCESCNLLKDADMVSSMSGPLRKWFAAHEEADRRRHAQAKEQAKLKTLASDAISKLSPEEIEALRQIHHINLKKK